MTPPPLHIGDMYACELAVRSVDGGDGLVLAITDAGYRLDIDCGCCGDLAQAADGFEHLAQVAQAHANLLRDRARNGGGR